MKARAPLEPVHEGDHVRGPADAAVTIVEYGDYDCPHTRASKPELDRLLAANPDVRFVFRHFPLRHLHENAELLSRVAEAAERQQKFWPLHDRLMSHRFRIDDADITADAEAAGVDLEQVQRDVDDPSLARRIEHDVQKGRAAGVHSTPTFFFEGALHDGHYDYDTLANKLAAARRKAA